MTARAYAGVFVWVVFYLSIATGGVSLRRQAPLLANATAASILSNCRPSCGTLSGIALIAVSHSNPNEALKFKLMRWASVVNRRAYAAMHGWPLYVSVQLLDTSREPPCLLAEARYGQGVTFYGYCI